MLTTINADGGKTTRSARSEHGAILLHVVIGIVVLIGFLAFVVDYGVMWLGRGQAQNAADSGALAGAVAMALDANGWTDRTETGPARTAARQMAVTNWVVGQAPDVDMATDVFFTDQPADMCPADGNGLTPCIRVDVYRNQARSNPLPSIFGNAFGLVNQGVRATATARVAVADSSDCMKPWTIPDKWLDNYDVTGNTENPPQWTEDDRFETHTGGGQPQPLPNPDVYVAPSENGVGTGFKATPQSEGGDIGRRVVLKQGGPQSAIEPGVFQPVRIPRYDGNSTGGSDYRDNISTCSGVAIGIGDVLESENGNMIGPTKQGVNDLIAMDPNAQWDPVTNSVENSGAQASTPCAAISPRVVAIPVYDTGVFDSTRRQGLPTFTIVNILGFFIDRMQGNDVVGYLTEAPGLVTGGTAPIDPLASFLTQIQLIR
jgi:Flp pilus assembly protein TadG